MTSRPLIAARIERAGQDRVSVIVEAPDDMDLQFIYRAALFVYWVPSESRLEDRNERETSPVQSFERIARALADEYGMTLRAGPNLAWKGLEDADRAAIETMLEQP